MGVQSSCPAALTYGPTLEFLGNVLRQPRWDPCLGGFNLERLGVGGHSPGASMAISLLLLPSFLHLVLVKLCRWFVIDLAYLSLFHCHRNEKTKVQCQGLVHSHKGQYRSKNQGALTPEATPSVSFMLLLDTPGSLGISEHPLHTKDELWALQVCG